MLPVFKHHIIQFPGSFINMVACVLLTFACAAPYVHIDMHPAETDAYLDAIYFSPHKFLGGPGTPGILIFNKNIYKNKIPDQPGGGTVIYSNPWKTHEYVTNTEQKEDGGTPAFFRRNKSSYVYSLKRKNGNLKTC
jgi:selenocysteine lyase/cysteine desulfurase